MKVGRYFGIGISVALLVTGCAVESEEFKALRKQVRLHEKQIVDLKNRQSEQQAKLEMLDNGFRILGDRVEEDGRRMDDFDSGGTTSAISPPIVSTPVVREEREEPIEPIVVPPVTPAMPPVEEVDVTPPLSAADLYRSALDRFTQENFQRSILEFEEFVANHPEHDLADNAQYWIGECYYAQKNFSQAVIEFDKVAIHFGEGNKAVAALLKKGLALKEVGRDEEAIVALEKVISKYPASDEAAFAERRLKQWR